MKRSHFGLLLFLLIFLAFVPKDDDPIEKLVTSLQKWSETNPQEKIYLHTDKPYYALGDTIWFKAYVTVGSRHQLSALSGALYVDLINEKDVVEKTLKLPLTAGMALGDFTLFDTMDEGNYRIRAYTKWMRNAGEDYFYDRTFAVGNAWSNAIIAKVAYQYKMINDKTNITAVINYRDLNGKPISDKKVSCHIITQGYKSEEKKVRTDLDGNVKIELPNDEQLDLKGGQIQTVIETDDKQSVNRNFPIKVALSRSDVQFFPESGSLVNGISSKVAFKVVGMDGLGIPIKGTITDLDNNVIVEFESLHAGMGAFTIKPVSGKGYKAKIAYADGSENVLELPKAEDNGYVLAVYQPDQDSVLVRINASAKEYNALENVALIAQSGGEVVFASQVKITKGITSIWLKKNDFPSGIAQFTLFNSNGEPLNERIAFIRSKDRMKISIKSDKASYKVREKMDLGIEANDQLGKPAIGSFSISVIDESKVPSDEIMENTILSNTLLTSDLKGYVEKPNYYFISEDETTNKALDYLMLTQGYRRFEWKDFTDENPKVAIYKAESLVNGISGKVVTLGNKPVPYGKVTLLSIKSGIIADTVADVNGRFAFDKFVLTDSLKFTVQGRTQKNGRKVEVIIDPPAMHSISKNRNIADLNPDIAESTKVYLENSQKQKMALEKIVKLNKVNYLKEVKIRANASDRRPKKQKEYNLNPGENRYDQIIKNEELQACLDLRNCLEGKLIGVVFLSLMTKFGLVTVPFSTRTVTRSFETAMLVVLDGFAIRVRFKDDPEISKLMGIFDQRDPNPLDIASIEVLRSPSLTAVYGVEGVNGVILINTRSGGTRGTEYNPSIFSFSPKGFDNARIFYSPRYDHKKTIVELADLRSTIYWNPVLKMDKNGKAKVSFFNAGDPGTYKVVIEGINADGELGRQVYRYIVE
ncbi:TonB-dependent receptor [Pedobacter foliorum]|uniref:TonB-dependent receptor n=1 Tax=Pedobacter foliorum TaxID=2739058 RepID=UPI001563C969|nr:TonB-dependent receptor [Pedobacter foliorum]NRF37861.1 TonB-dependent receptor [Pedobacter foliorum]